MIGNLKDSENRKQYNKQYYEKNREALLQKGSKDEKCELCGRIVRYQNIQKHMKSNICISRRDIYKEILKLKE